jgi:integrase
MLPIALQKSPTVKLTKTTISGLTLPSGKKDAIFFDEDLRGFGIRIRVGGKRVWVVQYQLGGHKQRRVTIGSVEVFSPEEARKVAREYLAKARLGGDPQREKHVARAQAKFTLATTIETYLKAKQSELRPKSFEELGRYLHKHWRPLQLPISQITRRDVAARLGELVQESGPIAAVRARGALSSLFAWAIGEGLADQNPVVGTNQPAAPRRRERVLSDAELVQVRKACRDDDYGRIIRLLILTGARRQEVGGMRWSELDLERGIWAIPSERVKNGRAHVLPLPAMAWEIIEAVPHRAGIDHLFGRGGRQGFVGFQKSKRVLDRSLSLPHWSAHDLRRSFATRLGDLNTPPHVIEALLNHTSGFRRGVAGTYNRALYEKEMRAALALWADHVRSLGQSEERKIIQLPRGS